MSDNIRMGDITKAGYCARGARRWFKDNGLDYRKFLEKNPDGSYYGIPRDEFLATGCPMAKDIVAKKDARDG